MFFGSKKIIGLDIGSSSIKMVELDSGRKGYTLSKFGVVPLNQGSVNGGEIAEPASVSQSVSTLHQSLKTKQKNVCAGMWGASVIIKKISMPKMDEKLVSEQIKWEAEQYIPFDINEISLEYHVLKRAGVGAESMEVLLVAAKQEFVFRFLEVIEGASLKCSIMDVSGFALANCFEQNYGRQEGIVALLNIGAGVVNFVVLEGGEIIFSRDITTGGFNFTSEINRVMGVSLMEAESLKISASLGQEVPDEVNNVIASVNESVVDEIRNSFEFFSATTSSMQIKKFYVTGGSIFVPGLVENLSKASGIAYEVMDPFARVAYNTKLFSAEYISQIKSISSVAMGLAMREEGDRK